MSSEPTRQPSPYSPPNGSPLDQFPMESPVSKGAQYASGAPNGSGTAGSGNGGSGSVPWTPTPAIDLIENTDELWVFIDLPGFKPDEIHVQGDARTLRVRASRPSETEEGRNVLAHERATEVERTVQLPFTVDVEKIDAIFEHGVCKLTVPKAANERYRDIDIRTAE